MGVSMRLERRHDAPLAMKIAVPVLAVAGGLVAGGVVMVLGGHDPVDAYSSMWDGSLGSSDGLQSTLIKATPLVLTGLAVATALRVGLWNIGGEGQLIVGAIAATGTGLYLSSLPAPVLLPAMILAGCGGGGLWAAIAAIPRALIGLNEIIVTLFMNYIAILLMDYLIFGPWGDPKAFGFAYSRPLPDGAALPLIPGTGVHVGLVIAILVAITAWWLLERTPWGFSVRVAGGNPRAAEYLGLRIGRRLVLVMAISGAIAGLAGAIELTGVTSRLQEGISVNYGYSGVLIAFLARGRLLAVGLAAFLFATLVVGSYALQTTGVAQPIATIVQALIIVFLLLGDAALAFRLRLQRTGTAKEAMAVAARP
jgi:general nucleoside transport system permease protein